MKFGKYLSKVVELSDPEWGPYWMNYKYLKKKVNDIVENNGGMKIASEEICGPSQLSKSSLEVEFFRAIRSELKKASEFFASSEILFRIRHARVLDGYRRLQESEQPFDKTSWDRLLNACVKFYKDVLLLENFAIMNYCGFSKILKKHDKQTGFTTRAAFMKNVMSQQNFTSYAFVSELLVLAEQLFAGIQAMESIIPLRQEEKLFIDAMRDMNYQASRLQQVSQQSGQTEDGAARKPLPSGRPSDGDLDEHAAADALFCAIERVAPLSLPRQTEQQNVSLAAAMKQAECCYSDEAFADGETCPLPFLKKRRPGFL